MNKKVVNLILGIMCFLLSIGIAIQIKTVNSNQTEVARTISEAELRDNILKMQEKYDNTYLMLENANKKLDNIIEDISKTDSTKSNYPEELENYNNQLGFSRLEGQGLKITVQDGNFSTVKGNVANFLVHDGDLIKIINLLKYAGAEAISINDERIVSTTSIACAGNIVTINGKKIGSPFIIKAIGFTEKLYGAVIVTDSYLKQMELEGVQVDIEKCEKLVIEKYDGIYKFNYAKNN